MAYLCPKGEVVAVKGHQLDVSRLPVRLPTSNTFPCLVWPANLDDLMGEHRLLFLERELPLLILAREDRPEMI